MNLFSSGMLDFKAKVSDPRFNVLHLILCCYGYNMHVEGLLPANFCLVTLLSLELLIAVRKILPAACLNGKQMKTLLRQSSQCIENAPIH